MEDKKTGLFIIGDVHGCWHTYQELLQHWDPERELLIQLGDLVDRGNFSPQCLDLSQDLQREFPDRTVFLRGNHEQMMLRFLKGEDTTDHWLKNGGKSTLNEFSNFSLQPSDFMGWLESRDLVWENSAVLVSHAGITDVENPFNVDNSMGVLWNRGPWKDIGKLQVIGHTPQVDGKATYHPSPPVWNVDTGAFRGICLTGIKLDEKGNLLEEINIPTNNLDVL